MTGHEIIKQLREMQTNGAIMDLIMESDIDLLLSIAEAFRPGDALLLTRVATIVGQSAWCKKYQKEYGMLTRLQAAAARLEE